MANSYSPPPTLEFFNSNFSNGLIYYNSQQALGSISTNSTSFVNMGNGSSTGFVPNSINIPIPGDYIITTQTAGYQSSPGSNNQNSRIFFKWVITKAAQTTINVTDNLMAVFIANGSTVQYGQFSRKVTFPVSGVWSLQPQWASDNGGRTMNTDAGAYGLWILHVHSVNPQSIINQQLTQFVNSSYTLMTNVDSNAWWGNLTNSTVVGYGNSITTLSGSVDTLNNSVVTLTDQVDTLQTKVDGITSLSTTSGGIRIKP